MLEKNVKKIYDKLEKDLKFSTKSKTKKSFLKEFIITWGCDLCGNPYVKTLDIIHNPTNIVKSQNYNICRFCLKDKMMPLLFE